MINKLFSIRIGNLELSNYYKKQDGSILPRRGSKDFSGFEVLKWEINCYFGKEGDYIYDSETGNYSSPTFPNSYINESCFKDQWTCYTAAFFIKDNNGWFLETVGSRPFDLEGAEQQDFLKICSIGFKYLNNEEYDR